jgi:hypothetical protein
MNVVFMRARSKLIIVGLRKTLRAAPLLKEFLDVTESQLDSFASQCDACRARCAHFEDEQTSGGGGFPGC